MGELQGSMDDYLEHGLELPAEGRQQLSLLNIYEFEEDGRTRNVVAFMDPVLAGSVGLWSGAFVGDFTPAPDGDFDPNTFFPNPEFIEGVTGFMNSQPGNLSQLEASARTMASEPLFLVDPRCEIEPHEEPEPEDVLGHFMVDTDGTIVPNSFIYNPKHVWFSRTLGVSGLLADRTFYEFLHPEAKA